MTQLKEVPTFIKNYMEEAIFNKLYELAKDNDFCTCPICRLDIAAYALNCLPPKYVATKTGEVYSRASCLQQQFEVDMTVALLEAIKVVSHNPRHH